MNTKNLATAIYTASQVASDFKTAVGGRVYMTRSPQTPTYPFVVYFFVTHGNNQYFTAPSDSTSQIEDFVFQFNVYSKNNSTSEVLDIGQKLMARFDWLDIAPTGYKTSKCKRSNVVGPIWIEDIQGFVYSIEYEIMMQKS